MIKGKTFDEMKMISAYFQKNTEKFPQFQPEFLAAHTINNIIEKIETLSRDHAHEILEILNDVNNLDHYDGAGWLDYKMHLNHLLNINGFKVGWNGTQEIVLK